MTRGWTIQRQLTTTCFALVLLFVGQGAQALRTVHALNAQGDRDSRAMAATVRIGSTTMELSAAADMLVVGAFKHNRKQIDEEWASVAPTLAELGRAIHDLIEATNVPQNQERARSILQAMQQWKTLADRAADEARAGRAAEASTAMEASEEYSDTIASSLVGQVRAAELEQADLTRQFAARSARLGTIAGTALILIVSVAVVLIVKRIDRSLRRVTKELRDGEEEVLAAAAQVAASAQALARGASEEAAALEETSASMEEMASVTRRNAASSQEAALVVGEVNGRVQESNTALASMTASMQAIQESSQKVSRIIKTIDEIAFQTNILALNAAVEAARAGEAGMGFAVVADEVRNLAQRSAQAARDTADLIEEAIDRSKAGAVTVEQVSAAINAINRSIVRVHSLVEQVSSASGEQTLGIDQVAKAIAQLETVTQSTAATAEEGAASSEELNAQAANAINLVRELEAMVGVSQHDAPATSPIAAGATASPRLKAA